MCVSERYFRMTVSPFTLNSLYTQGIIDYAPYELCNSGINVSSLNGISNPYLSSAMQGGLYQNLNKYGDSFSYSSPYIPQQIGINSQAGVNAWGIGGMYGEYSNAGLNAWGMEGIGSNAQSGMNAWGGFGDLRGNVDGVVSFWDRIPKTIKGLAAGLLMVGSVAMVLRRGKKPSVEEKTSFLSKLNPVNWFKKTKV